MYIIVSLGWWNNLYDYIFINNWFGFSPIKYLAGGGGGGGGLSLLFPVFLLLNSGGIVW